MTTPKKTGDRRVFFLDEETTKPILAAGVIFVKGDEILVQIINKDDSYQYLDFGGKTDLTDKSIFHTAARELGEEINYGIYQNPNCHYLDDTELEYMITNYLDRRFYTEKAKYVIFFVL